MTRQQRTDHRDRIWFCGDHVKTKSFDKLKALFRIAVGCTRKKHLLLLRIVRRLTKEHPIDLSLVDSHRNILIDLVFDRTAKLGFSHDRHINNGSKCFLRR